MEFLWFRKNDKILWNKHVFPRNSKNGKSNCQKISLHVCSKDTFGNDIKITQIFILYIIWANVLQTSILCKSTKYVGWEQYLCMNIWKYITHTHTSLKKIVHINTFHKIEIISKLYHITVISWHFYGHKNLK